MIEQTDGQMTLFDLGSWSGKTSPEHSAATKARTSVPSSKRRQELRTVVPLFLDLRKENGLLREPSWEMGGPLLGEYSMPSFGESPKDAVESHLSQILEENAHPKYSLSAKACQGILRRAEKRGKELPEILKEALIRQSRSRNEQDAQGGVKESSYSTIEQGYSQLPTTNTYCIQGNCIDRADTAGCNGKGWTEDKSYTLNTIDRHAVFDARGNGDDNLAPTITGDHQNRITDYTAIVASPDIVGTLMARDYKGPGRADTIDRLVTQNTIVRRLTPLECERLQGYPTGWTDIGDWTDSRGKTRKCTDSARYKALGNSIALPPWTYVLTRLNAYCKEHTMASLFDGIGGFPLIWTRLGGACLWASEIEEFPIAVTERRFE